MFLETRKNTVAKLLGDVGKVCMVYHDEHVRNLTSTRIQVDEAWAFIYAKQKNVATAKAAPTGAGDIWTWVVMDADTKLVTGYFPTSKSSCTNSPHGRLTAMPRMPKLTGNSRPRTPASNSSIYTRLFR
jgi:hypothetical protein